MDEGVKKGREGGLIVDMLETSMFYSIPGRHDVFGWKGWEFMPGPLFFALLITDNISVVATRIMRFQTDLYYTQSNIFLCTICIFRLKIKAELLRYCYTYFVDFLFYSAFRFFMLMKSFKKCKKHALHW